MGMLGLPVMALTASGQATWRLGGMGKWGGDKLSHEDAGKGAGKGDQGDQRDERDRKGSEE